MAKQTTIQKEARVKGIGLHTGNKSEVIFKPAEMGYGIKFICVDLPEKPEIEADWKNAVTGMSIRGSVIGKGYARVHTIEHIMASCCALGIDNLRIEINNNEPPILDGSAKIFADTLIQAGIKELDAPKEYLTIDEPIHFESDKTKISAYPSDKFEIDCSIEFDHPFLKIQQISLEINREVFCNEIASARTFCFDYEIEALQKNGLALGGSFDNAIVIALDGIHNKEPLRFDNEFVRHKTLDLIGDLYLAGKPIKAKIVADKPGHQNNIGFVKEFIKKAVIKKDNIKSDAAMERSQAAPQEKIFSHEEVLRIIPHRYPFIMIDKVKINETEPSKAIGYKCVSGNEGFFQGHFPGAPIMPGVLIIEAMAQTSCVMFLSRPEMINCLAYFMSIDNVKFRRPVKPGDYLELKVEVVKDGGRRGKMKGQAFVDGKLMTEAEFMFIIVDKETK
ncbi:MAG: bifunctional UDP-3-O-[3-hydroxymyristoyl] N-acetylglucosamine deacetylase/3-hydroxyacyl-ACP dehydratase [Endomicrobium sp.]|jgi:UDP-3-O-[3-hydroxymyristoyl] N-acetylglucosamine deacetylase/3-hydroxyacyl-[acyl-carrier-protein] dehydratase|nr:bifunctional UDP-3-O-[3-hydroxymyristoyl] N-acetylglucosamine deacetylase/3-hydroxyacyl-ACP dehydratase [Endomicrobium sp.]